MANWFISVNGDQKGPYPTDQLKQLIADGFVAPDAYVWRDGMAQWQPLSQTRIEDAGAPAPAPQPRATMQASQPAYQQPAQQSYGQQQQSSGQGQMAGGQMMSGAAAMAKSGWFSFRGRIGRKTYWLGYVVPIMAILIVGAIPPAFLSPESQIFSIYLIAYAILSVVLIIPNLAASVKRLHDRGRSGWFVLLSMVPIANIWIFIEVCFLKGTDGPNAFGPDPLA